VLNSSEARQLIIRGVHAAAPEVVLITWKPCCRTLKAGRGYLALSRRGGLRVGLALIVLIAAAFAAMVLPSLLGVLIDPDRVNERPTPPSLVPPKERGRFSLPNWVVMPRSRKSRS
jgi:hypothetical protein